MTVRHAAEHGIYLHEVDGYRLERFKAFHNEEYGVLTFTSDHGLIQDCEAAGSGDAGLYPGSAPDTGEQDGPSGDAQRYNTEIRRCDMHHNAAGYSGTAANAVRSTTTTSTTTRSASRPTSSPPPATRASPRTPT